MCRQVEQARADGGKCSQCCHHRIVVSRVCSPASAGCAEARQGYMGRKGHGGQQPHAHQLCPHLGRTSPRRHTRNGATHHSGKMSQSTSCISTIQIV